MTRTLTVAGWACFFVAVWLATLVVLAETGAMDALWGLALDAAA